MTETVLLYALSTLAQTCAALAAFVGAVGVFRLQILRDQRRVAEHDLRMLSHRQLGIGTQDVMVVPFNEIVERARGTDRGSPANEALHRWEGFVPQIQQSRRALIIFEAWNLVVIGLTLIGFNFIASLQGVWWVPWLFAVASAGTVIATVSCVIIWTRQTEGDRTTTTDEGGVAGTEGSTDALTGRLHRLERWARRLKWASIAILIGLAVSFLGAPQVWLSSLRGGAEGETSGFSESLSTTITRVQESWAFFAFVFGALVTFFWGLIGEIPDQNPLRNLPGRLGVWGARWSGRSLRITLRLVTFAFLIYGTLISPTGRNWLVGVLNVWKLERHF